MIKDKNTKIDVGALKFSVAPMVDVTNSTFRQIARLFSKKAVLYTEMIAADAIVHDKLHLLEKDSLENPCVLQLGGNDPKKLAFAVKKTRDFSYHEINLNCGCPSDKVQKGAFGAILMKSPDLIADCVKAMMDESDVPVTVKTRIGVDDLDDYDFTYNLVKKIYDSGVRHLILHARKAWLTGLSPKENRTIPPLDYDRVYKIKAEFPDLYITINGGITSIESCFHELNKVDGVMLGRAIIDNPYLLAFVDSQIYKDGSKIKTREELIWDLVELYKKLKKEQHIQFHHFGKHVLGLFNGQKGARIFRRAMSDNMCLKDADETVLLNAWQKQKEQEI